MEQIKSQKALVALIEDVQKHKDELGIDGTFPPCAFAQNCDEQWKTYMLAMPVYYESRDKGVRTLFDFDFKYEKNTKTLYDTIFANSTVTPDQFGSTDTRTSIGSFVNYKSAMTFYLQIVRGSFIRRNNFDEATVKSFIKEDEMGIIPIYFGHDEEAKQNIAIGHGWVYSVNKNAGEKQKKYAKEFIDWMVFSKTGKKHMKDMGYLLPYKSKTKEDFPPEPIDQEIYDYVHNSDLDTLDFGYRVVPNGPFRNNLSAELLKYANGESSWDDVKKLLVEGWKKANGMNEKNIRKMFADIL